MSFFQEVEGEAAIIIERGVYKQVPLYTRNGYLYAKTAGGFIRLMADGSTTKPNCRLEHLSWDGGLYVDKLGKLCTETVADAKQLAAPRAQLLLGSSNE